MIYGPIRAPVFWKDACRSLGQNCCKLLEMAGEKITLSAVVDLVAGLPEGRAELVEARYLESRLNQTLKSAWGLAVTVSDRAVMDGLTHYFLAYIPTQGMSAVVLMKESFAGVISGFDYEQH